MSYLVFLDPPSVQDCYRDPLPASGLWETATFPLHPPPRPPSTLDPPLPAQATTDCLHEYDDADSSSNNPPVAADHSSIYANACFTQDSDDSYRYQHASDENETGSRELLSATVPCTIYPAPSPAGAKLDSFALTQYTAEQFDSQSISDASLIGTPPRLAWLASSLTPLDQLRALPLAARYRPRASFLAAVVDVRPPKETGTGKIKAQWDLIDDSGAQVGLVLWEQTALVWCEVVRRGDIVYIGEAGISMYQGILQAIPNNLRSSLQICFRTAALADEDAAYVFHRAHALLSPEAAAVIKLVDWYQQVFRRD